MRIIYVVSLCRLFSRYYLRTGPMTLRPFDVDRIQALLALLDIVGYFVVLSEFLARS